MSPGSVASSGSVAFPSFLKRHSGKTAKQQSSKLLQSKTAKRRNGKAASRQYTDCFFVVYLIRCIHSQVRLFLLSRLLLPWSAVSPGSAVSPRPVASPNMLSFVYCIHLQGRLFLLRRLLLLVCCVPCVVCFFWVGCFS